MQKSKGLMAALLFTVMSLAGCAGDDGTLAIKVTPADDPLTQPFTFEATGPGDTFVWDFNDGTGPKEGRKVEHTFGFTDGDVTVRVTATTADGPQTASTKVTLGTGRNANPEPAMVATSDWLTPGETIRISAADTTDSDGDPILYRWNCNARGQPLPAHNDDHGTGGIPFGVQVLATVGGNITGEATAIDGDLCAGVEADDSFTRNGIIEGSFTETGVYDIDVEIRDPKSPTFIGRLTVFVTADKPPAVSTLQLTGSLTFGSGGNVQSTMDELGNPSGITWDEDTQTFQVPLPGKSSTITWDYSGAPGSEATYELLAGGSPVVPATSDGSVTLDAGRIRNLQTYEVVFQLAQGGNVDFTWTIEVVNDMKPTHLYEAPLA